MARKVPGGAGGESPNKVFMFDFDGVVADSLEVFFEEFTAACRELGYDRLNSREAFLKLFEENMLAGLLKAGFPMRKLRQLGKDFAPRIAEANRRVAPFPGMPELLSELAAIHPTYIITSNVSSAIHAFIETHGISGILDVLGSDHEASKVKKIRRVRKLHKGARAYYVGDTKGDMVEGRKAGAVTVAALWGWHEEQTLRSGKPDFAVSNVDSLRRILRFE